MYSIKLDDDSKKKTAKGIVRNAIENHLKHAQYKHILDPGERMTSTTRMIRMRMIRYLNCQCHKDIIVCL